jgi:hypothetical protein
VQPVLQQTPSAQKPLRQSVGRTHGPTPLGLQIEPLQYAVGAQSTLVLHAVRHEVPPHA